MKRYTVTEKQLDEMKKLLESLEETPREKADEENELIQCEGGEGKIACLNQKCPVLVRIEWGEIRHCSTKAEAIAAWNRRAGE